MKSLKKDYYMFRTSPGENHAEGDKPQISDLNETLHGGISLGAMNFGTNYKVRVLVHFTSHAIP